LSGAGARDNAALLNLKLQTERRRARASAAWPFIRERGRRAPRGRSKKRLFERTVRPSALMSAGCLLPAVLPPGGAAEAPCRALRQPRAAAGASASARASRRSARSTACASARSAGAAAAPAEDAESPAFKAWESRFANTFRRKDLKRIMILGAGPIVIGQARGGCAGLRGQRGAGFPAALPCSRARSPARPASSTTRELRPARRSGGFSPPLGPTLWVPPSVAPLTTRRRRARREEGYEVILINSNPVRPNPTAPAACA
jgi:hypothetical protein